MRRLLLAVFLPFFVCAQERITSFVSDVTINTDGTLRVRENISVRALGKSINHGIVRDFPTTYCDRIGTRYVVDFDVKSITLDGQPVPYRRSSECNGVKLYIGDAHTYLKPGNYTYTIEYTTNRQIGFFENHDELYWNVTGNGCRLPIDYARATIHVPQGAQILGIEAATGYQDEAGKNFIISDRDGSAVIQTSRALRSGQGLTATVAWPKGFVAQPSIVQNLWLIIRDNLLIILILFIILLCCFFVGYSLYIQDQINSPGVVIPQFYPPQDMIPSSVGTVNKLGFHNNFIAADVVNLAVKGLIKIDYEDFGEYTLSLVEDINTVQATLTSYERSLLECLFLKKNTIHIGKTYSSIVERLTQLVQNNVKAVVRNNIIESYFMSKRFGYMIAGIILLNIVTLFYCGIIMPDLFLLSGCVLLITGVVTFWFASSLKIYSYQGRRLQDHIDGFKLYLSTAEINRMHMIGTPPTKTPELYEKYLPYAMALGLEQPWSDQFAPIFEQLKRDGHPYQPHWYVGHRPFRTAAFANVASGLSRSMSTAISASSVRPGSSSGMSGGKFGGGGGTRSGGGGGGGGVGGW